MPQSPMFPTAGCAMTSPPVLLRDGPGVYMLPAKRRGTLRGCGVLQPLDGRMLNDKWTAHGLDTTTASCAWGSLSTLGGTG